MIIGSAGHIDHGKTTLVKALTGVDTDRLKEEKARGISIELGYAYVPLPDGGVLGFIDVPGHEKFIATMLAGATGIDFGLIVVAADDGVMPQTREHVQILDLLGVKQAAVALTKIDRVGHDRRFEVLREVTSLLADTSLAGAPAFPVSAVSGEGVAELRGHLLQVAQAHHARDARGYFRLAVDRSFSIAGAGTIVTGTVFSGEVRVGDEVCIQPSGTRARVRGIHAQNRPAERGRAGERCALNLAGVSRDDIARGDWIADPALAATSDRLDVELYLHSQEPRALANGVPLHVHLGATHLTARAVPLDVESIEAGGRGYAQLKLSAPTLALHGDTLVLRDNSASRTIGRARVIDAFPPARRRRSPERLAYLAGLCEPTVEARLGRLVESSALGVDVDAFALAQNLRAEDLPAAPAIWKCLAGGGPTRLFSPDHWQAASAHATNGLAAFHQGQPDQLGPDLARFRRMLFPQFPVEVVARLVREWVADGALRQSGPWIHLPQHSIALSEAEQRIFRVLLSLIASGGAEPPWVRTLASEIRLEETQARRLLLKAARLGEVYQVVKDLFYSPAEVARLAGIAARIARDEGVVRAASFRDATGLGRKRAIQILEFFDRIGYTRRIRDDHLVRDAAMFPVTDTARVAA